jgi:hypothetical protein
LAEGGGAVEAIRDEVLVAGEHGALGKRRAEVAEEKFRQRRTGGGLG